MSTDGNGNHDSGNGNGNGALAKERRQLRQAGMLVILGLVVEAVTLFWSHPTAFVFFAVFGIGFVLLGILLYLWILLRGEPGAHEAAASASDA